MKFSETDAHKSGTDYYNSQRLLFNKHFAWCLLTKSLTDDPYKDWATIDLAGKYLIYGLQVCAVQQPCSKMILSTHVDISMNESNLIPRDRKKKMEQKFIYVEIFSWGIPLKGFITVDQ